MGTIDVVIVDEHQLIRAGFSLIMQAQSDLKVVGEGASAEDALQLVRECRPQVVCIAARLGDISGFDVTRSIRALPDIDQPSVLILVGSRDGDPSAAAKAAGATSVLAKYATPESIVMTIRAAALPV